MIFQVVIGETRERVTDNLTRYFDKSRARIDTRIIFKQMIK